MTSTLRHLTVMGKNSIKVSLQDEAVSPQGLFTVMTRIFVYMLA